MTYNPLDKFECASLKLFLAEHKGVECKIEHSIRNNEVIIQLKHWSGISLSQRYLAHEVVHEWNSGTAHYHVREMMQRLKNELVIQAYRPERKRYEYVTYLDEYPLDFGLTELPKMPSPNNAADKAALKKVDDLGMF